MAKIHLKPLWKCSQIMRIPTSHATITEKFSGTVCCSVLYPDKFFARLEQRYLCSNLFLSSLCTTFHFIRYWRPSDA